MNTNDQIKKFREKNCLTQKGLADMCGVTTRTVQNWENGGAVPEMVRKYLLGFESQNENISSIAKGNSVSVSAAQGSNVNVSKETSQLLTMLEHSQKQIDEHLVIAKTKDEQISRLLSIIEKMSKP